MDFANGKKGDSKIRGGRGVHCHEEGGQIAVRWAKNCNTPQTWAQQTSEGSREDPEGRFYSFFLSSTLGGGYRVTGEKYEKKKNLSEFGMFLLTHERPTNIASVNLVMGWSKVFISLIWRQERQSRRLNSEKNP